MVRRMPRVSLFDIVTFRCAFVSGIALLAGSVLAPIALAQQEGGGAFSNSPAKKKQEARSKSRASSSSTVNYNVAYVASGARTKIKGCFACPAKFRYSLTVRSGGATFGPIGGFSVRGRLRGSRLALSPASGSRSMGWRGTLRLASSRGASAGGRLEWFGNTCICRYSLRATRR